MDLFDPDTGFLFVSTHQACDVIQPLEAKPDFNEDSLADESEDDEDAEENVTTDKVTEELKSTDVSKGEDNEGPEYEEKMD
ncbi:hypothetical protein DAPPUDRAFT_332455 [Daphnia pulex]|uniref:Uncharacterized protein n=1 Tax=Daphnia pulex TaxID=6669 RepID=E9HQ06_DAPPU|nr:hypothetical protein DAPPUDRAFT_332455 [Daphnia pulex]|eukprot:EFX66179.1 hypothetical protein DAPPUDRAFT_332455 [Daphnia pulex]